MKTALLLSALLALSGCSTLSKLMSFDVNHFDSSEYGKATHLRTTIALDEGKCNDPVFMKAAAADINAQAFELALYSQGIAGNDDAADLTSKLHLITSEFSKRYASVDTVSQAYCDDKMAILLRTSATVQKALGGKPQ